MRRLTFAAFGDPAEVVTLVDAPTPRPGAGEVLVRMRARAVNPSDLTAIRGLYGVKPALPAVPGFEGTGDVLALGPGVSDLAVGDRVVTLRVAGTWQEQLVAPEGALYRIPAALPEATAAQLLVNPLTAWVVLTEVLAVEPDQWIGLTAAGSTLGRMAIELARILGFRLVSIVRRPEQADELLALGADAAIATDIEPLRPRLKAITHGAGLAGAIDSVGGEVGGEVAAGLSVGGTMVVIAGLSGEAVPFRAGPAIFKGLTIRGFWLTRWIDQTPRPRLVDALDTLVDHLLAGRLTPPVAASYDLAEHAAAFAAAGRPGRAGKVLLTG